MNTEYLIAAWVIGMLLHFAGDLREESRKNGGPVNPFKHIAARPYQYMISILGGAGGLLLFYPAMMTLVSGGQLTDALFQAAVAGYTCDSLAGKLSDEAQSHVR